MPVSFSIHALLAESDSRAAIPLGYLSSFSIHALLAESDTAKRLMRQDVTVFLSTLSLRRATHCRIQSARRYYFFYPRSPCGERRVACCIICDRPNFSIHALLAESDDRNECTSFAPNPIFYPRSPCGERLYMYMIKHINHIFLSTLSLRRATTPAISSQRYC